MGSCSTWNWDYDVVLDYGIFENAPQWHTLHRSGETPRFSENVQLKQKVLRFKHSQAPVTSPVSSPRLTHRGDATGSPKFFTTNIVNELTQIRNMHNLRMMSNEVLTIDDIWKQCNFRPWANILQCFQGPQVKFCPKCQFPISQEINELLCDSFKTVAENPLVSESTGDIEYGKLARDVPQVSRSQDTTLVLPQDSESVLQSLAWQEEEAPTENSTEYDPGNLEECKAQLSPETLITFNRVCPQFEWPRLMDEYFHVEKRPAEVYKNALYDGEWKYNITYGRGVLVYPNNEIYLGNVDRARRQGYGLFIQQNGSYYIGDWKNDTKEGKGSMYNVNGYKYTGEFSDDKEHGEGQATFADGNIFEGIFKKGKSGTSGKMTFTFGGIYRGNFKNQLPDGLGQIFHADQTSYVGRWKSGKRHGQGTMTNAYGGETTGQYRNDKLVTGLPAQKPVGDESLQSIEQIFKSLRNFDQ